MNVVDFAEGILGNKDASSLVAKCLRTQAGNEDHLTSLKMIDVADRLDLGQSIDIESIREIGEGPLASTQWLFLKP